MPGLMRQHGLTWLDVDLAAAAAAAAAAANWSGEGCRWQGRMQQLSGLLVAVFAIYLYTRRLHHRQC